LSILETYFFNEIAEPLEPEPLSKREKEFLPLKQAILNYTKPKKVKDYGAGCLLEDKLVRFNSKESQIRLFHYLSSQKRYLNLSDSF